MAERQLLNSKNFTSLPFHCIGVSAKMRLKIFMDPDCGTFSNKTGALQSWEGLAELMNLDNQTMTSIKGESCRLNKSPTDQLMEIFIDKNYSVAKVLELLENLERYDLLQDHVFSTAIRRHKENFEQSNNLQSEEITSTNSESEKILTIDDKPGNICHYDAFVSFAMEDINFVYKLTNILENYPHNLKLFIPRRNELPSGCKYEDQSELMGERCTRVLIIMSENYLKSDECDFQRKYAHSLSSLSRARKMIPIKISDCKIPRSIQFISQIDYTNGSLKDWFWERLAKSIK